MLRRIPRTPSPLRGSESRFAPCFLSSRGCCVASPRVPSPLRGSESRFACCLLRFPLQLLDLEEVELDRCRPAEDGDHHLEGVAVEVDLLHHPLEVRERAVDDAHALAALERVLRLRLLARLLD